MAKILVIEDEDTLRTLVSGILTDAGYEVIEAADAPSGFAAAAARKPDLILSDFIMPGVLGVPDKNLFEVLSSDPRTKNIPIIIVSALPKETIRSNTPERLWPRILSKPFDYFHLDAVIADVLKQNESSNG